jgi:hypothetical protein
MDAVIMWISIPMAELTRITLRYRGSDVDNGTMPIDDVVEALQGFSGAYGKVASVKTPDINHQLRVSAVNKSSFEMYLVAAIGLAVPYASQIQDIRKISDAARWVFQVVAGVVQAKKHTKGQPYTVSVKGNSNTLILINADGAELAIPPDAFDVYKRKLIDTDLNKIAAPLHDNAVASAELVADEGTAEEIDAVISSSEREYFRPDHAVIVSRETAVTGRFISLNKENNKGTFKLGNGKNVPYKYTGGDAERFHTDFAYKGPVKVSGTVYFDENLEPTNIDVDSVEHLQGEITFPPLLIQ